MLLLKDSFDGLNGWKKFLVVDIIYVILPSFLILRDLIVVGDILPPPGPAHGLDIKELTEKTQSLENEIRVSKQRHEEMLNKFKSSCKVWKDGTKKLSITSTTTNNIPIQDGRGVDGVAAAAKDAESTISQAMITQPTSHTAEIEEINNQVLKESGIPNAKIRKAQKCRPVGKHIEYQPAKKPAVSGPSSSMQRSHVKNVPEQPVVEKEETPPGREIEMESEVVDEEDEDGLANEAFEAMEAMDFDPSAEFDYDSENHGNNDLAMDMGVD